MCIRDRDKSLNAAWFVFGTKSELKAQKILQSGDVLKSADFNKDYFTPVSYTHLDVYKRQLYCLLLLLYS